MLVTGCTQNSRARTWGGSETIHLKDNEDLINVTWKDNDLWLLTQNKLTRQKFFREYSSYGILEGEIIFK